MSTPRTLLMALVLEGKKCLVIGGGEEAALRCRVLVEVGAVVVAVADAPGPALEAMASSGAVSLERRAFGEPDVLGAWLVVLTERDPALVERLGVLCEARRILFSAIDQPSHNSVSHVGIARDGPVTLAVSTDGRVPALAKRLKDELERAMHESGLGAFAERVAQIRDETPGPERKEKLSRLLAGLTLGAWRIPGPGDE